MQVSNLELEELKKVNKYNDENLKKIKNGYPIQYLIGYVNFFGNKIFVNKNTLIPRYETEYLVEKTLNYIKEYNFVNPKVLDLCTGTGCIGLTLKKELPYSDVTLNDISSKALEVTKMNAKSLDLEVNIIESDLFNNINEKYDIIISNPPYVMDTEVLPIEVTYEPKIALFSGEKGLNHIERIFKEIKLYLKDKYLIALEVNEKSKEDLEKLTSIYFKDVKVSYEKDLTGRFRYLFIIKVES